jgi:hypothetical protein
MNPSQLSIHDTDAGFTGNLDRASLSPAELAIRQPRSQPGHGAVAGYPQPGGAIIYQRGDGAPALGNLTHMERGMQREGRHWPAIITLVLLGMLGLMSALSDSGIGEDIFEVLRKLI